LKVHPPSGRVLNAYNWGGYLVWNDPNFKDFVDSRADVFVYAGVFKDYIDLLGLESVQPILDKYGIRYVLFPRNDPVTTFLGKDPKWKPIFDGRVSIMLERVGPVPKPAVAPASASKTGSSW
jgi:hypothetical protein